MSRATKQKKIKQPKALTAGLSSSKINPVYPEVIPSISERGSALQNYLARISKIPLLSKEEEFKLTVAYYETKDEKIGKKLVQSNLRFVVKVVAEYSKFSSKVMDLIQEGNIGLIRATKEFNPYKGARLITYAVWWIRGYIQEYLMKHHSIVRIGTNKRQQRLFYLLQKEKQNTDEFSYNKRLPTIAKQSQTPVRDVEKMKEIVLRKDFSLDQSIGQRQNTRFLDIQTDDKLSLDDHFSMEQMSSLLKKQLKGMEKDLNAKEQAIIYNRFLKDPPLTLQDIANDFSVTREAIRQTEQRLMYKLKKKLVPVLKKPY